MSDEEAYKKFNEMYNYNLTFEEFIEVIKSGTEVNIFKIINEIIIRKRDQKINSLINKKPTLPENQ